MVCFQTLMTVKTAHVIMVALVWIRQMDFHVHVDLDIQGKLA